MYASSCELGNIMSLPFTLGEWITETKALSFSRVFEKLRKNIRNKLGSIACTSNACPVPYTLCKILYGFNAALPTNLKICASLYNFYDYPKLLGHQTQRSYAIVKENQEVASKNNCDKATRSTGPGFHKKPD